MVLSWRPQAIALSAALLLSEMASPLLAGSKDHDGLVHFRDCDVCPEMVVIPPGRFMMGATPFEISGYDDGDPDAEPYHEVTISYPFAIGVYEITFDEWDACVADGGCDGYRPDDKGWGRGRRPVINVSWRDAQTYVAWLRQKTGKRYRLPSEAEWEYAARAGTRFRYFFGNDESLLCRYANGLDASVSGPAFGLLSGKNCLCNDSSGLKTMPVGSYRPNAFGLYDMLGNVAEWVEDRYFGSVPGRKLGYEEAPADGRAWLKLDPSDPRSCHAWPERDRAMRCKLRVVRGGDFWLLGTPFFLTVYRRMSNVEDKRLDSIGFRVVREIEPGER